MILTQPMSSVGDLYSPLQIRPNDNTNDMCQMRRSRHSLEFEATDGLRLYIWYNIPHTLMSRCLSLARVVHCRRTPGDGHRQLHAVVAPAIAVTHARSGSECARSTVFWFVAATGEP